MHSDSNQTELCTLNSKLEFSERYICQAVLERVPRGCTSVNVPSGSIRSGRQDVSQRAIIGCDMHLQAATFFIS